MCDMFVCAVPCHSRSSGLSVRAAEEPAEMGRSQLTGLWLLSISATLAAPNMLFRERELSLQNAPSLSSVHLCGPPYLQISDWSLTLLFLNANLKITCSVVFLLRSFLHLM